MEMNMDYAAIKLLEILYERGLVNYQTLQAVRECVEESRHISQAA